MLKKNLAKVGLLLVVVMSAVLVAPFTQASPEAQAGDVIRLGYLGPAGTDTANGAQLAIDQINGSGGFAVGDATYRFELLTLDRAVDASSLDTAVNAVRSQDVVAFLGPDDNAVLTAENIAFLAQTGLPVLTAATSDSLTDTDAANMIFRTRGPERVYSQALATYLIEDLGLTDIAVVQTDVESTEAVMSFEIVAGSMDVSLRDRIQTPGGSMAEAAQRLIGLNPAAVVMWGPYADAVNLLQQLRQAGWSGRFAYRHADEAARAGVLPDVLANGVIGVNSWNYAFEGDASRIFLREYVVSFGQVPGPLAVAAYDAIWFLRAAIRAGGTDPAAFRESLIGGVPLTLVQGTLHPIEFGNGDLARLSMVYTLGPRGGPTVQARFEEGVRLTMGGEPAPGPEPTAAPTEIPGTAEPTATLEGTWVRVTVNTLNVRNGPGFNFAKVGEVALGDTQRVLGAIADYSWMAIDFQGGVGWVKTEYTEILGDLGTVSIIQSPPTPTPAATATPTLPPNPDIVIDTVVLSPTQPIPGRPFTATVTVRNAGGGAAGRFPVAATFEPGAVYTAAFVEGLAGGQTSQIQLTGTLMGTGVFQVGIVADLNKEIAELDENNNIYNLTYRVDYPLFANQSGLQLSSGTDWDMFGGVTDFRWDGYNIAMLNGSKIGILGGTTYENAHYDMLTPGVISNTVGYGTDQVLSGMVYGLYTAEGKRAVLRVDNRQGETIWVSYRVYNDTP